VAGRRSWTRQAGGAGITRAERPPSRPGLPAAGGAGVAELQPDLVVKGPLGCAIPFPRSLARSRARCRPAFSERRRPEAALRLIGPGFFFRSNVQYVI
jgi:hypothetical protein